MQATSDSPPQHERTLKIVHVKMTYSQLMDVVVQANRLASSANQGVPKLVARESLSVSDGTDTLKTGTISADKLPYPPKVAYSARYEYSATYGSPVSDVDISLNDVTNEVMVSGSSSDQVETIARTVQARFDDFSVWSGQTFRLNVGGAFVIISLIVGAVLSERRNDHRYFWTICVPAFLGFVVLDFAGGHILPGTAIYAGDPSWWSRNAAMSIPVGLLLAVAGIGLGIPPYLESRRANKASQLAKIPQ